MMRLPVARGMQAMASTSGPLQLFAAHSTLMDSTGVPSEPQGEMPSGSEGQAGAAHQRLSAAGPTSGRLNLTSQLPGTAGALQGLLGIRATHAGTHMRATKYSCMTAGFSSAAHVDQSQPALVVPFPKLSHVMNRGKIKKWHKHEGERVNMYDVLFELTTEELTEEAEKVGDYEGSVPMLVEAQEEGYLARILRKEGEELIQVGTPVGLMCEEEEQVEQVAGSFQVPTTDVYDSGQPQVKVVTWQSYLADKKHPGERDLSCMG